MTHFYYIFVLFCMLLAVQNSKSQTTDSTKFMTLHDCMEYAVSNSTRMRIQKAETGDARIGRRDAILTAFTPTINAQAYAYYNFGRSIDPQTNTYFTQTSFHNNYAINAGFTLFNGFEAVNNIKISKTGLAISQSQEKQAEADICLATMEAYYNVVYYNQLVNIYKKRIEAAEAQLSLGKRQEDLGQKSHADVVQMEADLVDCQYDLTNAQNLYNEQLIALSDLMFWPLDEPLLIDTVLPTWKVDAANADDVVNYAMNNNPDVQIAQWQKENAKRELKTAIWQLLPTVELYAGWNTNYFSYQGMQAESFRSQVKNNGGEYVELAVSIPIYNRLKGHSNISRKRHAYEKASAEVDKKRREVESEVRRAVQDCQGTAVAYTQAQRKAEVQEESYALNRRKMEQGLISPIEFQTVSNNYLKAKCDEMNSLFKYLIKQSVVKYYYGVAYVNQ
ncbi:MAG: TolC family protein [Marinilabiliaceae bacterium]|nr:TolC family protein [Marinilabiliaceae bacterium]